MDCARVDTELIAFELAVLDGATRAAVEMHLTGCARCVSSFLALKRAIDAGEGAMGPSEFMRMRIRKQAQQELAAMSVSLTAPAEKQPERRQLAERKRAPWMAVAVAAAAAVLVPFAYQMLHTAKTAPVRGAAVETGAPDVVPVKADETIDTARTTPENLAFL